MDESAVRRFPPDIEKIRARHPRAYEIWTREEDARLIAGYLAGRTVAQLAETFARQPSAIKSRLNKVAFEVLTQLRTYFAGNGRG